MEYPRRLVHEDYAKAFRVICFKAFNHEFNRAVILFRQRDDSSYCALRTYHVCHREACHVKNNRLTILSASVSSFKCANTHSSIHPASEHKPSSFNEIYGESFEARFALFSLLV